MGGLRPPINNHFDAIWLAWLLAKRNGSGASLLRGEAVGLSVYKRLQHAFNAPPADQDGIVHPNPEERAVGFIFHDSIYMTGKLLMATLLRRRAALQMRDLALMMEIPDDAALYSREAEKASPRKIAETFSHPSGWLRASTGVSSQPDVFGTLHALHSGAIAGACRDKALNTAASSLEDGQIEQEGALRGVPLNHSHSPESAWEKTHTPNNTYQNGAYWHMPAGWLASALLETRPDLARAFLARCIAHMRREDFRKGSGMHAPWEWIHQEKRSVDIPLFGPSATMPHAVLAELS